MSAKGCCYDNVCAETFFASLKKISYMDEDLKPEIKLEWLLLNI
nr:hypothetical protein [Clostridium kluyveri]